MKIYLVLTCVLINHFLIGETESFPDTSFIITPVPKVDRPIWWADRHKEKVIEARKNGNKIDIVMIGDSITHNLEKREDHAKIWKEYFPQYKFLNLGFGADKTENVLWRIQNGEIEHIKPKLVILMIGTNNSMKDSPEKIAAGTKLILKELLIKLPNTQILMLATFSRGSNNKNKFRRVNEASNKIISQLRAERLHYLDINHKFIDENGNLYREELMPDHLHPNAAGVEVWAQSIQETVEKLMKL